MGTLSPSITLRGISCRLRSRFSSRSRLESIAFLMRMRVLSMERGFSRKSYAPSLVARTAVSMVPWPEIMITSGALSISRIFCRVSSPSMPGNHTSNSTTSNGRLRSISRQPSPSSAATALKPSSSSTPCSDSRILDWSSTIRMLCMLSDWRNGDGFRRQRQFHDKPGPYRLVLFYSNRTVVILDDSAHDRESQSCAAFFGGKIRHEEPLFQLLSYPMTGVGDLDLDRVPAGH